MAFGRSVSLALQRNVIFSPSIKSSLIFHNYSTVSKDKAYVTAENGLPRFHISLPSRNETCVFALKPLQHTIGDLCSFISKEDRGIDRIIFQNSQGERLAQSNTVEMLLSQNFTILVNDKDYQVTTDHLELPREYSQIDLSQTRMLISRMHELLSAQEVNEANELELKRRIEDTKLKLQPFEKQKDDLAEAAAKRTRYLTWFGLGAMGIQFGLLARLTWWEYSWDIMEPVTYFVGYGTSMAMYAYYVVTRQEYCFPQVFDRQYLKRFYEAAEKSGFKVEEYNSLCDRLAQYESDLARLRDPMLKQLPLQQPDMMIKEDLEKSIHKRDEAKPVP